MWQILQIIRNSQNAMNLIFILLFTFFFFPKVHRTKERATKGQLVSEGLFGFLNSPKKRTKISAPVG